MHHLKVTYVDVKTSEYCSVVQDVSTSELTINSAARLCAKVAQLMHSLLQPIVHSASMVVLRHSDTKSEKLGPAAHLLTKYV